MENIEKNDVNKVAVALSGGLDSSVSCLLLKNQGFHVVAITAKMVDDEKFEQVVQNAKNVADKLEIEHYVLDLTEQFRKNVIDYFENSYINGLTPNPCVVCNKTIKWGVLFDFAINELGCDCFATGHYAQLLQKDGRFLLYPAKDVKKDQLYYLFELTQIHLSKTIFPLSGMAKDEVRKIAFENDLPSKSLKESQDICFVKNSTKKYLLEHLGVKKGKFILAKTSEVLGFHDGFYQYTTGQRKGIGIAYSSPLYVLKIDADENVVYLGLEDELYSRQLCLEHSNFQDNSYGMVGSQFKAMVKIRYNSPANPANVKIGSDFVRVEFDEKVSAVTKGQKAVIYDILDYHLIGGGTIV